MAYRLHPAVCNPRAHWRNRCVMLIEYRDLAGLGSKLRHFVVSHGYQVFSGHLLQSVVMRLVNLLERCSGGGFLMRLTAMTDFINSN